MIDASIVNTISPIAIPAEALWAMFGVVIVFAVVMSFVLFYHWHKYGYGVVRMGFATAVYITGTVILIGFIFSSISGYIVSV